jgi:catalase
MKNLTTAAGAPVVDNQNTQTAGPAVRSSFRTYGIWKSWPTSRAK